MTDDASAAPRLGVLVSGTGSILAAMLDAALPVACVLADRRCGGIERARRAGVPTNVVERKSFGADFDRDGYSDALADELVRRDVDVVAMAGFGTVLSGGFFDAYEGRVLNTHPSLLPAFAGWHAVSEALSHGVKVTGCTVHVATRTVDAGPVLAQRTVPVLDGDTVESLHERIKCAERELYPATIAQFLAELAGGSRPGSVAGSAAGPPVSPDTRPSVSGAAA